MVLKRTTLQNLFLFIVTLCVSINASNSNLLIQFSSINFIIFFFLCLKNKKISLIKIRIEKLDIFKDAESVGIKIIRKQKK